MKFPAFLGSRALYSRLLVIVLAGSTIWIALTIYRDAGRKGTSSRVIETGATAPPNLTGDAATAFKQSDDGSLATALTAARYGLEPRASAPFIGERKPGYLGMSHEQNLNAWFDQKGVTIRPTESEDEPTNRWRMTMRLKAYGYGRRLTATPDATQKVKENRIEYRHGSSINSPLVEWYENNSEGIEQGFTLTAKPQRKSETSNDAQLRLVISVAGDLRARLKKHEAAIDLRSVKGETVLTYNQLSARDAEGKQLSARMSANEADNEITLEVDDRTASYPITIDPQVSTQLWSLKNRIEASDGAKLDKFGSAVALQGDTLVIGARLDDVDGVADRGSVYVFVRKGGKWT